MSGRRVTLPPPGAHRDVTRGLLASCTTTSVCPHQGIEEWRAALSKLLVLLLLVLAHSGTVHSSATNARPGRQHWPPEKPLRFPSTMRLFQPGWEAPTSPSLMVTQTLLAEQRTLMPTPPPSTVINIWNTPQASTLKPPHIGAQIPVGSSLLLTRTRTRGQVVWQRLGQRPQDPAIASTTHRSQLDSGEGCHPCYFPPHRRKPSLTLPSSPPRGKENQPLGGVDEQPFVSVEDEPFMNVKEQPPSSTEDQRHNGREDQQHHTDYAERTISKESESASHGALKSNNTSEVVNWGPRSSDEGGGSNSWVSQASNKPSRPRNKNPWPFLPGAQAPRYNRDEIRANLDSDETREEERQVDPFNPEAVIDNTIPQEPPADVSLRYGGTSPSELTSLRTETQAESPHYFALGAYAPEGNEIPAGSSIPLPEARRVGLHSPRPRDQNPPPPVQLREMKIPSKNYTKGRQSMVVKDNENDSHDCDDWKCGSGGRGVQRCDRNKGGEEVEVESECVTIKEDLSQHSADPTGQVLSIIYDLKTEARRTAGALEEGGPAAAGVRHAPPLHRHKRKIDMKEVTVVEGGLAALPCDLDVSDPRDSVQLILWIKEGVHTPLYSYDYRELLGGRPKETKPDANSTLARRTSFRTDSSPAALLVERVEADDGGIYRCRVDFLLTPTRNKRVNLTVIVPPNRARVSWHLGNSGVMPVNNRVVGPFLEGGTPTLTCSNDDGWPPPAVVWYEGDEVLDESYVVEEGGAAVVNELSLGPLSRGDLGRRLSCLASNTNQTQPATTTVTLAMTLSIVGVRVEEVASVWAGERAEVLCRVWGSRPPPTVVWWLGSVMLPPTHTKVVEEGNLTISILHFTPKPQDDGAMLICQATNEKLPDQAVQDSRLLSVSYAPQVKVLLGKSLDPLRIKEGDDVYFECEVKAKPPIFKVAWRHNGVELVAGAGVFVSNMSLVVQRVTRGHGGDYTCEASNVKDTCSSPPLHLDVKYAPVCARQERVQHSVAKLENAEISCKVHANPANVTFRWTFNNTAEAIDVPDGRFVVVGTESRVNYTPMNELDYGTLLCWANNTIGVQQHPCVFHIVAAGKPDPPHNCRVFDVTISSLQVTCLAGDDGGLTQNFLLQVYQVGSTSPLVDLTRATPSFSVANLRPATAYKIIIAAINDKGASRVTELKAYTVRVPETQEETSAEPTRDRERGPGVPLVVAVGGGVVAVCLVAVAAAALLWLRVIRRSGGGGAGGRRLSTHSKDGASTGLPSEASPPDDRNPDLISHTPDPTECQQEPCGEIATISASSSFFLHNGGPTYPASSSSSAAVATSAPAAAPSAASATVGGAEYTQLVCPEPIHSHSSHAHSHAHSPTAAVPHVPYFPDTQQPQVREVPPLAQEYPAGGGQCYSTLERKRRQAGGYDPPPDQYHPEAYVDPAHHNPFPHLYQAPSGAFCHTPHGSQYNLAQYQASLAAHLPHPVGSPTQSLQGTLRRGSKKVHKSSSTGATPLTHPHHHHCEVHEPKPPVGPEAGQVDPTLKRERRRDVRACEGMERGGDESEVPTPNTARKSKRESAV